MNKYPSEWGKEVEKSFREVGDGRTIEMIYQGGEIGEIMGKLESLIKTKVAQEIQKDWGKIEKSSFCKDYKEWKKSIERETYWESKEYSG